MAEQRSIAFLGLGVMGAPMAGHLARAGHRLTVYNRTASRAEALVARLAEEGSEVALAPSPAQAAAGQDAVLTCVGNDDDLAAVVLGEDGALAVMRPGALFVDHTTVSPAMAKRIAETAGAAGVLALDAPVSGGQAGAEKGALAIMCGGSDAAMAAARPVLETYAARIIHVGEAGAGQATKAVNQVCIAGVLAGLAEGVRLAQASALDTARVFEAISGGAAQSWQMDNRWATMAQGQFDFGFAIDWMRKDLAIALGPGARARPHAPGHRAGRPFLCAGAGAGRQPRGHQRAPPPLAGSGAMILPALHSSLRAKRAWLAMTRCVLAALPLTALLPTPAAANTLIDNVEGIAINREGEVDRFAALVFDEEGIITHLLDFGDDVPDEVEYREDGGGRVMIPGLVDAHLHMMALGLAQLTLDLSQTRSLEEALARLAAYAAAHPDRPWLIGRGWNQERWGTGRFPTAAELDAIVGDRPVWLERVDGHAGWANSAALAAAGITAASADPAGGRIERIAGSREPAGVLVDNAMELMAPVIPPPRAQDRDLALHEAQELLLANGITAAADMGTGIEDWMTFRRAGDAGRLRVRIMSYAASVPEMLLIGGTGPTPWLYDGRLRMNGVKLYLDGALGSRGAALKADYADDPGNRGLSLIDGTQLRNLMSRAALSDFQVAIHAIGDAANAEALGAIEELSGEYSGDRRWRIEHAQVVDPADIARFGQHGIIASMQPVHQPSDRLMAEARLGPDRLAGAYAWRSIGATGALLAFGSDAPVEAPDPFAGMAAAISRTDAAGEPFGGWMPEETITREAALAAYTAAAAYAGHGEEQFGRLAVGERADFVLLDRDPLLAGADEMRAIRVLETWVGGRRLYRAGRASSEQER